MANGLRADMQHTVSQQRHLGLHQLWEWEGGGEGGAVRMKGGIGGMCRQRRGKGGDQSMEGRSKESKGEVRREVERIGRGLRKAH